MLLVSQNTSLYIFIASFFPFLSQDHQKVLAICLQEHSIALLTFSPVQFGGRRGQERAARNKSQSENEYKRLTGERIHNPPLYLFAVANNIPPLILFSTRNIFNQKNHLQQESMVR